MMVLIEVRIILEYAASLGIRKSLEDVMNYKITGVLLDTVIDRCLLTNAT